MKDVLLMANNTREARKSQPWLSVRSHFDFIKITIMWNDENSSIQPRLKGTLAQDFHTCAPVGNRRLPQAYFDDRWRRWRSDFPLSASRVSILGAREHTLATILISNTDRQRAEDHHRNILFVGQWLARLGYDYRVSMAEITLDTYNQDIGLWLATSTLPTWARLNRLWNFANGYKVDGGSLDGLDEYMFRGRVIWAKTRSGKQGQRLPRRQFHTYYKPPNTWRHELRLFRSYLRDKSIRTVEELYLATPALISKNIRFRHLDRKKLREEYPSSRNWALTGKSIPEQLRIIMERLRFERRDALRYFRPIKNVDLDLNLFSTPQPDWPCYKRADASRPQRVKKRRRNPKTISTIMLPDNWTGR